MPTSGAKALPWFINVALVVVFLYVAFWLGVIFLLAAGVAWWGGQEISADEDNWPFFSLEQLRKMPGYDPMMYNDTEHPDFPDEKDI